MNLEEKIKLIEEEIRRTDYNKATEHHIGRLKAKLARLREELEERRSRKVKTRSIRKEGDATVCLLGYPSVGKSTLLNALTNANSKIGYYAFTTTEAISGIMEYKGAKIQIIDLPGIIEGASEGRGMGREILSYVRMSDLIIIMADIFTEDKIRIIEEELYKSGIRINQEKPRVRIEKKVSGGLNIVSSVKLTKIGIDTIREILNEFKIHSADVFIDEDITIDRLIDALSKNVYYVKALYVINKVDLLGERITERNGRIYISAEKRINLEYLKEKIFESLGFIRIYLKPQGKKPDFENPLILRKGSTIKDVCERIHRDFIEYFRYAQVWGKSVKIQGQRVGLNHVLEDEDIVTIIIDKKFGRKIDGKKLRILD